jgi:hypothetical protein
MPAAVAEAGLTDRVLPLHHIASEIAEWCSRERSAGCVKGSGARPDGRSDRPALAS